MEPSEQALLHVVALWRERMQKLLMGPHDPTPEQVIEANVLRKCAKEMDAVAKAIGTMNWLELRCYLEEFESEFGYTEKEFLSYPSVSQPVKDMANVQYNPELDPKRRFAIPLEQVRKLHEQSEDRTS